MNNSRIGRREQWLGFVYISPWIAGFLLFTLLPIGASLIISFTHWDIYRAPTWIGLANYERLFTDPLFYKSIRVTLLYTVLSIPLSLVLGLLLSMLLNMKIRGINFYRTLFYLPSVITGVAVATLWMWIFNGHYGILNHILSWVGIEGPQWLDDPRWIVPSYVIISLWGVGGSAIIFLGGLQNIPEHLYEAAKIDGAGAARRFLNITLPLLTPTLFFLLVMGIIASFQVFTVAYIINGGGSSGTVGGRDNAGLFYMLYLYQKAFRSFEMGYASAMAWIGGLLSFVLSVIVYKTQNRWVYYESDRPGKEAES